MSNNETPLSMLSETQRLTLLATLPLLTAPPPPVLTMPGNSRLPHLMAELLDQPEVKPHPSHGGEHLDEQYLLNLDEMDCIWRFRYAHILTAFMLTTNDHHRFTAQELIQLADVLKLPDPLITRCGYRASALESLALLCARLRSAEDQWSISLKYNRPQSAISEITNMTAKNINDQWSHLLAWDHKGIVCPAALNSYSKALQHHGAPSHSIAGFIDCTIRQTCRPSENQELAYTGYKKFHGMKFQGVAIPNGLMAHLDGPYRAPQNDSGVLNESGLLANLAMLLRSVNPRL
jgi:hypothetical protein